MEKTADPPTVSPLPPQRLSSIDAFRGFVMFLMLAEILHFSKVAAKFAEEQTFWGGFWRFLAFQQSHVPWTGCTLHDLIYPGFVFLVGVAVPFSIASRIARGQSYTSMTVHAFQRAFVLVLLGVFLVSQGSSQTNWTFINTLTRIGVGYGFLFLLAFCTVRVQVGVLVAILVGYWAAFAAYPLPGPGFDWSKTGVSPDWEHNAVGFAAHWNKNTNLGWAFDVWFLNLFPRKSPFIFDSGGYPTLSSISSLGTMILGLLAGNILLSNRSDAKKIGVFVLLGIVCLLIGWLCGFLGICPIVKRIGTPSWVLFSTGFCFLFLAGFHLVLDVLRCRKPFFPLIVIGSNSIVAYCIASTALNSYFIKNLKIHLGGDFFKWFGAVYEPLFIGAVVLLINWLILFWMYRQKIFVRV
ncbi:MAG: DUF5009 domain-containing protein [Planctomycetaceae bacterium]|nr:DUF5009 domain-containing protein [Planctomycetaceae bacterium]